MAKELHNDVFDSALDKIATCTHINFCSTQPANYAGISAVSLANVTVTAGDGNGDYTIADVATGRKLTISEQTAIVPTGAGTATYVVFDDGTTLLMATTMTSQILAVTDSWTNPAFDINLPDPT